MFMSEAIQEFGFDCKIRKLSPKTITNYQKQLKYLQRYLDSEFGVKEVEAIKSLHIKQFLSMKDDQGCKARYINGLLKMFKTFFNCNCSVDLESKEEGEPLCPLRGHLP